MKQNPKQDQPSQRLKFFSLTFRDVSLEADFRTYWEAYARPNVLLISLMVCISGLAAAVTTHRKCYWSRAFCTAAMSVVAYSAVLHGSIQCLARWKGSRLVLDERMKAYGLVNNLTVSMLYIMLLKDFDEIPLCHPVACFAFHGWLILFLQVTMQSSLGLHAMNILVYLMLQCHAALNLGQNVLSAAALVHFCRLLLFCTVLPACANYAWESTLRRSFKTRRPLRRAPH